MNNALRLLNNNLITMKSTRPSMRARSSYWRRVSDGVAFNGTHRVASGAGNEEALITLAAGRLDGVGVGVGVGVGLGAGAGCRACPAV